MLIAPASVQKHHRENTSPEYDQSTGLLRPCRRYRMASYSTTSESAFIIINIYSLWCLSVFISSSDHGCLMVYVWKVITYFLRTELRARIL